MVEYQHEVLFNPRELGCQREEGVINRYSCKHFFPFEECFRYCLLQIYLCINNTTLSVNNR